MYDNKQKSRKRRNKHANTTKCKENQLPTTSVDNDSSWYFNVPELSISAASISFGNPTGYPIENVLPTEGSMYVPGIMTLSIAPVLGDVYSISSPINRATRLIYDKVNYKNARNRSYDPADLMITIYAIASAYQFHAHLKRLYGVLNTSSYINAYIPENVITALGFDSSVRLAKDELYFYLNTFALAVNKYAVPLGMPLFERACWLYSNIFMDSDNAKAGLVAFKPEIVYYFDELSSNLGSVCRPLYLKSYANGLLTIKEIVQIGEDILTHLQMSQDLNFMSADIMQAYDGNVLRLDATPIDYSVVPVYSPEVLNQIHNARLIVPDSKVNDNFIISQNEDGSIHQVTKFEAGWNNNYKEDHILDLINDNPTPQDVMVATRLMPLVNGGTLRSSGTEVVTDISVYSKDGMRSVKPNRGKLGEDIAMVDTLKDLVYLTKFKMHPLYRAWYQDDVMASLNFSGYLGDLYNYTSVSTKDLSNMHTAALLSEFSIPFGSK